METAFHSSIAWSGTGKRTALDILQEGDLARALAAATVRPDFLESRRGTPNLRQVEFPRSDIAEEELAAIGIPDDEGTGIQIAVCREIDSGGTTVAFGISAVWPRLRGIDENRRRHFKAR